MKKNNKTITLLGSTGSVGRQTLEVAAFHGFRVDSLAAGSDVGSIEGQIRLFKPSVCAMYDEKAASELKIKVADTGVKILSGAEGVCEAAAWPKSDIVVNAISGIAGLRPTLSAIKAKKTLALANKESLVTAGTLVIDAAERNGVKILPVDSEHSAIFQCMAGKGHGKPRRILLTCSGGPFFGWDAARQRTITKEMALAHPTWSMGPKITIDSSTLMNKGFEVIEAAFLFGISQKDVRNSVEVLVHRESIVHSMVEFRDMTVMAQLSRPDMRLCVMYALSYPDRFAGDELLKPLDFASGLNLTFKKPDTEAFGLLEEAYRAYERGGIAGAALNGANERAVELFLDSKIPFRAITDSVTEVANGFPKVKNPALSDIEEADREARIRIDRYFS